VESPLEVAWAFPKFNGVFLASSKEMLKLTKNCVVTTTRWNGTCSLLTSAKLTEGYLVVGITRELDKKPSLY